MKTQAQTWTHTYGSPNNDYGYSIEKTYDGGYIIGGTTSNDLGTKDILLLKLNAQGDSLWTQNYGGTYNDESYCVKQCRDSGFVICGYKSTGSANMDFYIIKTNASGQQQWTRTFGGTLNEGSYSIIQTFDNGFAVCGYTASYGAGAKDMQLLKYSDSGQLQWQQTYGGTYDEIAYSLVQTPDSGYLLTGTSRSYNINNTNQVYCVRTTATGDTLWTHDYPLDGSHTALSLSITNGNYYLIAGKAQLPGITYTQPFALKINQQGDIIFEQTYDFGTEVAGIAYSAKEMPDLSYMLAGSITDPTNGQGSDVMMLKIGEWGEVIDQQSIGTTANEEARSFCIDDIENIVTVGKAFNAISLNNLYVVAMPICKQYYPRYIWINNVFNQAPAAQPDNIIVFDNSINSWKVDNQKLLDLSIYLNTLKYSGIIITHLEDVFKNADSVQLKSCMAQVVVALHNAGLPVILNQFRSDEEDMTAIASRDLMIKLLSSSILFNQTVAPLSRFDGLLLDYEFWGEFYALDSGYAQINDGFRYFDAIATEFTTAKANPNNHFKTLAMWIGNTVFACDTCDFNGDGLFGNNTIYARPDDETLMNMFDSHQFDRLVLSFFLDDQMDPTNTGPQLFNNPLTFLERPASGININQFFARLYYLGENNLPTNVIPQFHAGTGNGGANLPKLEQYLNGTGPWWSLPANGNGSPHFLNEVEQKFDSQYFDPDIFEDQQPMVSNKTWGTTAIRGFEWFRYQLGPLEFSTLSTRVNDKIKSYYWVCDYTLRLSQSNSNATNFTVANVNEVATLTVYPQPLQTNGELIIKNFNCEDADAIKFNFFNRNGQLINNGIVVKHISQTEFAIIADIENKANYEGLLLIQATYQSQIIACTKVLILKNQ